MACTSREAQAVAIYLIDTNRQIWGLQGYIKEGQHGEYALIACIPEASDGSRAVQRIWEAVQQKGLGSGW